MISAPYFPYFYVQHMEGEIGSIIAWCREAAGLESVEGKNSLLVIDQPPGDSSAPAPSGRLASHITAVIFPRICFVLSVDKLRT
jgi:hypothetical protein